MDQEEVVASEEAPVEEKTTEEETSPVETDKVEQEPLIVVEETKENSAGDDVETPPVVPALEAEAERESADEEPKEEVAVVKEE
ncbi:hypothetical protein ELD68_35840, partial [Klebsiella pneumoniae]|nr:hypothetical protein [Klebsiella pneumoniae]